MREITVEFGGFALPLSDCELMRGALAASANLKACRKERAEMEAKIRFHRKCGALALIKLGVFCVRGRDNDPPATRESLAEKCGTDLLGVQHLVMAGDRFLRSRRVTAEEATAFLGIHIESTVSGGCEPPAAVEGATASVTAKWRRFEATGRRLAADYANRAALADAAAAESDRILADLMMSCKPGFIEALAERSPGELSELLDQLQAVVSKMEAHIKRVHWDVPAI